MILASKSRLFSLIHPNPRSWKQKIKHLMSLGIIIVPAPRFINQLYAED